MPLFLKGIAIDSQELTFRLLIAICWGIINGFITARILNWFLIEAKVKFKIFTINQNETRTTTILKRLFFPIAALLSFPIIINILLFISYSSKNLLKESINNIVLINIMLFFLICLIAFIIIFESLSYLKNLLLQLNHMIREELNLSDKVILTNFDDIGLITSKINVLIDRLFSTFVKIKQLTMQVSQSGNLMHGTINKSHERAVEIESNILLTEKEIKIQITNIENMVSSVNSIIQITKTSIDKNNGLVGFVNTRPEHRGNVLTVARNGSVGETFYQEKDFCSTEDVHVFNPKFKMNKYIALFLITLIRKEKYKYSYGRKWGLERMNESIIKLPICNTGNPDWQFMEDYVKSLPYSSNL